jgi:hypothetical protein
VYELVADVELPEAGEVVPSAESNVTTVAAPLPVVVWVALLAGTNNACIAQAVDPENVSVSVLLVEVIGVEPAIQSQHKNENPVPGVAV